MIRVDDNSTAYRWCITLLALVPLFCIAIRVFSGNLLQPAYQQPQLVSAELLCNHGRPESNLIELTNFKSDGRIFMYQHKELRGSRHGTNVSYQIHVYLPVYPTSESNVNRELAHSKTNCFIRIPLGNSVEPEKLRRIRQAKSLTCLIENEPHVPTEFFEAFPETSQQNKLLLTCQLSEPHPFEPVVNDVVLLLVSLVLGGLFSTMAYSAWTTPITE